MHLKPFNLSQSAFLWLLCGSLLISPGVASADQAADIAAIRAFVEDLWTFSASQGDAQVTVPSGPTSRTGFVALSSWINKAFFRTFSGAYLPSENESWLRLIYDKLGTNTNSVDLSSVEDSLSSIDGEVTQIFGLLSSELTHQHSDVEDILRYLQENVNGASRDVYQNDVTNSLKDLGTSLDALREAFQNGFYGQGNSSAPSVPEQPPPSSDIPAPLADQLYAHSFTVDIDETQVRTAFDNTQLGSADHRFVFWSGIGLGGFSIPSAVLDMGGSEMSLAADALSKICRTVYWLMYYLAIFFLVRREYTYYASLGHTSEGVN